jgi:hypothetical protein
MGENLVTLSVATSGLKGFRKKSFCSLKKLVQRRPTPSCHLAARVELKCS